MSGQELKLNVYQTLGTITCDSVLLHSSYQYSLDCQCTRHGQLPVLHFCTVVAPAENRFTHRKWRKPCLQLYHHQQLPPAAQGWLVISCPGDRPPIGYHRWQWLLLPLSPQEPGYCHTKELQRFVFHHWSCWCHCNGNKLLRRSKTWSPWCQVPFPKAEKVG